MIRALHVLLILSSCLLMAQSPRPLTRSQLEQLVLVLPDKALGLEIRDRGTSFKVDRLFVDHFREIGAGDGALDALAALLPNSKLTIQSTPALSDVSINGRSIGTTNDVGEITVSDLDAGHIKVLISKDRYRSQEIDVDLARDETRRVIATLERVTDPEAISLLARVQYAMGGINVLAFVRDWTRKSEVTWEPTPWSPTRFTSKLTTLFVAPSSVREESVAGNRTLTVSNGLSGWSWSSTSQLKRDLPVATATGMSFRTLTTLVMSDRDPERVVSLASPGTMIISDKFHNSATLTIDLNSYLPQKLSWSNLDGATLEETYSNWRRVDGVMCWFYMTRSRDRKVFVEEKVKEYRINKGVAEPKSGEARPKSKSVYTDQIEAAGNYSVPLLDSLQQHPVLVSPEVFGKTSSSSMKRASELLYVDPNNAKARLLLESAYFDQGDMEGFLRVSRESLLRGGEVVARLVHQDRGQFHLSALVCTPTHIYFVPTPSPDCGLPSTAVPLNRIEEIRVENDKVQGTFLRIRLRSGAVLGRPSENRLWILGSHKERRQVAYGKGFLILTEQNVIVSPSQAQGILETVATLLRQAVSPTP